MGTRRVRLSDEAYELVQERKGQDETVSEAIERLIREDPVPLTSIAGILSDEQATAAREAIEESRRASAEKLDRLAEKHRGASADDS